MVPDDFVTLFTTLATVGATFFGLIFVVISIKPEVTHAETTSVTRQVLVASAYSALLNPLIISLFALLPHETIGNITIIMSVIGLINVLVMGIFLLRDARSWMNKWQSMFFLLIGFVMFGVELFYALQLDLVPGDTTIVHNLVILLVLIYLYGIARAWDLVGARQFHIQKVLDSLISKGGEENSSVGPKAEVLKDAHRLGN